MRRGVTFVELILAMAVLAIISMGLLSAFVGTSALNSVTGESIEATNVLRSKTSEIWAKSREHTEDNPLVVSSVEYTGLDAMIAYYQQGANNQFSVTFGESPDTTVSGTIGLFLNEALIPGSLGGSISHPDAVEVDGRWFGPMDLDGDTSSFDDLSAPTDGRYGANLVPVEVTTQWNTRAGVRTERRTLLVARTGD